MNSDDEEEIRAKTEFEKESILAERHEKRRLLLEQYELLKQARLQATGKQKLIGQGVSSGVSSMDL